MDSISTQRLALVWPTLAEKITWLIGALEDQKILVRVVQGLRTYAEQDVLYAQGRTTVGPRVTNVKGGFSYHNFGLAVDCVPSLPDTTVYSPDWSGGSHAWETMIELGVAAGLTSGANWVSLPDRPHFQLTGQYPVNGPNDVVRELAKGGLPALWE